MSRNSQPDSDAPVTFIHGHWRIDCLPRDSARISCLQFQGRDLLTKPPPFFHPPDEDFGKYETRPAYGRDACRPAVVPCEYPCVAWRAPDHGELCWLPWEVAAQEGELRCKTAGRTLPIQFKRSIIPSERSLIWHFKVINQGAVPLYFQHVMHPLVPLDEVECLALPTFETAWNRRENAPMPNIATPGQMIDYLLQRPTRTASMILLRGLKENAFSLRFRGGPDLRVRFPLEHFNTLEIWWNRDAYPDEEGRSRNECAFEPIPGSSGNLKDAAAQGSAFIVPPNDELRWSVIWEILADPNQ